MNKNVLNKDFLFIIYIFIKVNNMIPLRVKILIKLVQKMKDLVQAVWKVQTMKMFPIIVMKKMTLNKVN